MFIRGFISWWYFDGLRQRFGIIKERLTATADFFSVGLLALTLFAPYRQISAEKVAGSISDKMHAFLDRSISRLIGAFVRTFMIIFGLLSMLFQAVFGALTLIFWLFVPLLPVIGLIMLVIGWVPQWMK